ncbi:MAG: four helix bundle protein, partial [Gemmatimonadota bacterium]
MDELRMEDGGWRIEKPDRWNLAMICNCLAILWLRIFEPSYRSWWMDQLPAPIDGSRARSLEMKERTMSFAESVAYICRGIPLTFEGRHVSSQLFRAGTSVAANYRAARRARSRKEFISKIGLVIEEADESLFWLEFAMRIEVLKGPGVER